jgi:broad specificity phosphatase PhoE
MTTWHWVRHGPTHAKTFVGWRDVPADLSNDAQIDRLRAYLPSDALLVSSDLLRATATASAIAGPGHRQLAPTPSLREFNLGIWDGMHFDDVAQRDPDLSRSYWERPGDVMAPLGESWNMASHRIDTLVRHLNTRHPEAQIIAVAHIGVILTQVARARHISPHEALGQKIDNLSVTRITWRNEDGDVSSINHLP